MKQVKFNVGIASVSGYRLGNHIAWTSCLTMLISVACIVLLVTFTASRDVSKRKKATPVERSVLVKTPNPSSCECSGLYPCDPLTGKIITDGSGIASFRKDEGSCQDIGCCELPDGYVPEELEGNRVANRSAPEETAFSCGIVEGLDILKGFPIVNRIGGKEEKIETDEGQVPWMLAVMHVRNIGDREIRQFLCGASLLTANTAVTAAQCVNKLMPHDLVIQAGQWNLVREGEAIPPQEAAVRQILIHPNFKIRPIKNDIAIIQTASPFKSNLNVNTICLPNQSDGSDWGLCQASGWGLKTGNVEAHDEGTLKSVALPLVPFEECTKILKKSALGKLFKLHSSFLCAGGNPGEDTCKGDGGGPLACEKIVDGVKRHYLVGIVSWGLECGVVPGAYTNVAKFYDWISQAADKLG